MKHKKIHCRPLTDLVLRKVWTLDRLPFGRNKSFVRPDKFEVSIQACKGVLRSFNFSN